MFPQFGANYNHAEDMPNGTHQDWRGFRRVRPDFFHDFLQAKKAPLMAPFWDLCWTVIVTDQSSRKLRRWSERVG